jgi:hypothetical protein
VRSQEDLERGSQDEPGESQENLGQDLQQTLAAAKVGRGLERRQSFSLYACSTAISLLILVIFTTRKIELWSDKKDLIDLRVLIR